MIKQTLNIEIDITEEINYINGLVKKFLPEIIKSEKFNTFLKAIIFSELKNKIIDINLLDYFDREDMDYIVKRAIMELTNEKND